MVVKAASQQLTREGISAGMVVAAVVPGIAAAVLLSTIGGVGMWSVPVVLPTLQAEFNVARGDASLPYTLGMVGFAFGGVLMGRVAVADRLLLTKGGALIHYPDFMFQYREAANFPWVSQAEWLYTQMVRWEGMTFSAEDAEKAARVFRPDVYRSALLGSDEPLPGASSKVEGSLTGLTAVSTQQGAMTLESNSFFDGMVFDPARLQDYISHLP